MQFTTRVISFTFAAGLCVLAIAQAGESRHAIELVELRQTMVTAPHQSSSTVSLEPAQPNKPKPIPLARTAEEVKSAPAVSGRVLNDIDSSVADVTVVLYRGRDRFLSQTNSEGFYEFNELPSGRYRAFIDSRKLPEGLLPPFQQHLVRPHQPVPSGWHGTLFDLSEDEPIDLDLRVFRKASVRGWVSGPNGNSIAGVVVQIRSTDGVVLEARTDEFGEYVIDGVYPGDYVGDVRAITGDSIAARAESFEIIAGEARVLPALTVGANALVRVAQHGA